MSSLYDSAKWHRLRAWVLQTEPLCRACAADGRLESAQVVDHIIPHRGDPALFYDDANVQPLCRDCHDRRKQGQERRGFSRAIGDDGWPGDPGHPANTGKTPTRWDATAWMPPDIPRLPIPSVFLCGPPAAGKTTWARERAARSGGATLILDPDVTAQALRLPAAWADTGSRDSRRKIARRELALLRSAARDGYAEVIVIRSAPRPITRTRWVEALGPLCRLQVMRTPAATCAERVMGDPARRAHAVRQLCAIRAWYREDRR